MSIDINEAIAKIDQIHNHLSRSEMYRGYRPKTLFWVGTIALTVMLTEQLFFPEVNPTFIWCGTALVIGLFIFSIIGRHYFGQSASYEKKQIRNISLQFLPGMLAGFVVTAYFFVFESNIQLLPGIWSIIFGLTLLGLVPYITRMLIFVTLFYIICGTLLLIGTSYDFPVFPYGIGLTFGLGHWLSAIIMKLDLRKFDEQ